MSIGDTTTITCDRCGATATAVDLVRPPGWTCDGPDVCNVCSSPASPAIVEPAPFRLPMLPAPVLPLLTTSSAKAFRACARLYSFKYELGYRAVESAGVLRFGTLVHAGMEAWWLAAMAGETDGRIAAALAAVAAAGEADPYELARAEAMLVGYHAKWADVPMRVLAVEAEFTGPLVNPETGAASRTWARAGKIDAIAILGDYGPEPRVVEHKTSSEDVSVGSDYWVRLRLDPQISTYLRGAEDLGVRAAGCLYDVLAKPMQRPSAVPIVDDDGVKIVFDAAGERVRTKDGKKWRQTGDAAEGLTLQTRPETPDEYKARILAAIAENPDRYYQRGEVVRLEEDVADAAFDTWQTGRLIREAQIANRWPRNPDACSRYGRTCEFLPICTRTGSLDDPARYHREANAHRELTMTQTPKEEATPCNP